MRRPRIGAAIAEVPPARMAQLKAACPDFPTAVGAGLVVTGVRPGGPAAGAGLREEDIIVGWGHGELARGQPRQQGPGGHGQQQQGPQGRQADTQQQHQQSQQQSQQQGGQQQQQQQQQNGQQQHFQQQSDVIAVFAAALKRHLDGPGLGLRVVRAAPGGGYEFVSLCVAPEEAPGPGED